MSGVLAIISGHITCVTAETIAMTPSDRITRIVADVEITVRRVQR